MSPSSKDVPQYEENARQRLWGSPPAQ